MREPRRWQGVLLSMRVRIVVAVVLLLLLSSIVSVILLRQVLFERLDNEIRVDLSQEAEEFRLLAAGNNPQTGEPFGDDLEAIFDVYFEREVPDEGELLLAFVDGRFYRSSRAQDAAAAEDIGEAVAYWLSLDRPEAGTIATGAGEARYTALPLAGEQGSGLFVVANFPDHERSEIDDAVRVQATTQLVLLVLTSLLGLVLASRVLRPLRSLAETAATITDTDLTRRIPVKGRDEASQIARAFNDMLGRLEQALTTQRRFLDDAGHELRAPLTVVRGHVELLELDTDPRARQETAALITDEIDRMSRIVNDLLLLARAEQPDFLRPEPVDLHELLGDIHRKASALAPRDWRLEPPAQATITADRQRLTQAMVQLAQNACQHTPERAVIRIGSELDDGQVRMWVHDSGPGVPPDDADRLFQRFQRGSRRNAATGAGLGLSIVRAIAEAHGGQARLAETPAGGARFELVIPAGDVRAAGHGAGGAGTRTSG